MAHENIRFPRNHMAIRDEYFYYFDERNDTLNQKVSDGATAFTYPLDPPLGGNAVISVEYDGFNFWTLQEGNTSEDVVIKKWLVSNYICEVVDTIELAHSADHKFNSSSFSLEFYNTTLVTTVSGRTSQITLAGYADYVDPGTIITLGPNSEGVYENVTVTGTLNTSNSFGLDFYTFNTYEAGTKVYFPKSIWLVNNFLYNSAGGSLYKITLPNKQITEVIADEDFEYVDASCFYNTGSEQYILYVLGTTVRFLNIDSLTNEKSMLLDNIKNDQSTGITVYDIKVKGDTLYRLQNKATYFGTDYTFSTYNYQFSTIRPFVDSITVDVNPKILPSNGINVAEIQAVVRDQFNALIQIKSVTFSDSDATGFISSTFVYTNHYGIAASIYKAGTIPGNVTITALTTQYD